MAMRLNEKWTLSVWFVDCCFEAQSSAEGGDVTAQRCTISLGYSTVKAGLHLPKGSQPGAQSGDIKVIHVIQ